MKKSINSALVAKLLAIATIAAAVYVTTYLATNRDTSPEHFQDSVPLQDTVSPSPATVSRLQNGTTPYIADDRAGSTMPGEGAVEPSIATVEKEEYTATGQSAPWNDDEIDQYIYHPQHIERYVAMVPFLDDPEPGGYVLVPADEAGITFLRRLGLEPGDLVMSYDGIPLYGEDEAQRFMKGFQGPADMELVINRQGNVVPVTIQLGQ